MQRRRMVRPSRPWGPWRALMSRLQGLGGPMLLLSAALIVPLGFYVIPNYWVERNRAAFTREWIAPSLQTASDILNVLTVPPTLMDRPEKATEAEIRKAFLDNPLLDALRLDDGRLLVRRAEGFGPPGADDFSRTCERWMNAAVASGQLVWNPSPAEDPEHMRQAACILKQPHGYTLCRWRPGSPEVDAFLLRALGPSPHYRVGLVRKNPAEREMPATPPRPGQTQVWFDHAPPFRLQRELLLDIFADAWRLYEVGVEADEARFASLLLKWRIQAFSLCILLFGGMGTGYVLLQKSRRKAVLELDRMASMAHSLKTPLGILMLRCDSIRLGQFDPARTETELARICEDVERLTLFIDQSLRGFQKGERIAPPQIIPPAWFKGLAADLALAFEDEGRTLRLDLDPGSASADPASLRTALITLLENALNYATETVTLRTRRRGPWMQVEVEDEGPGLSPEQLRALGSPFMRFRIPGKEGFQHPGQGLGLFLLFHAAEHEGWGLEGASAPGAGLKMTLMIPAE